MMSPSAILHPVPLLLWLMMWVLALCGCASTKAAAAPSAPPPPERRADAPRADLTEEPKQQEPEIEPALLAELMMFNSNEDPEADATRVIVREDDPVAAIYFDFDVSTLDEANLFGIERAHRWLMQHEGQGLILIGHADRSGAVPYNQQLALERAERAGEALVERGVDPSRLAIVTHGEEHIQYIKPEYNRRVVFRTDPANAYGVNDAPPVGAQGAIRVIQGAPP